MGPLSIGERRRMVAEAVQTDGVVSVAQLARMLGVSRVTARADLQALARAGRVRQIRGGAVAVAGPGVASRPLQPSPDDAALLAEAAGRVADGEAIALDGSDLGYWLAGALRARRGLTVVAGAVDTAQGFALNPTNRVLLAGSMLAEDGVRLRLHPDERGLHGLRIRTALLCCSGCDASGVLFATDPDTAELKRTLIAVAQNTLLLLRNASPDPSEVAPFGHLRGVSCVLTTQDDPGLVALIRANTELVLCPV